MKIFADKAPETSDVITWGPLAGADIRITNVGKESIIPVEIQESWILCGLTMGASEIVDIRNCFNNRSYIYALGNDQKKSALSLNFVVFVGKHKERGAKIKNNNLVALEQGLQMYITNRISNNTSPLSLTIGNYSRQAWLVGVQVGHYNAEKAFFVAELHFVMKLEAATKK